jgi:hypothetical protein
MSEQERSISSSPEALQELKKNEMSKSKPISLSNEQDKQIKISDSTRSKLEYLDSVNF